MRSMLSREGGDIVLTGYSRDLAPSSPWPEPFPGYREVQETYWSVWTMFKIDCSMKYDGYATLYSSVWPFYICWIMVLLSAAIVRRQSRSMPTVCRTASALSVS